MYDDLRDKIENGRLPPGAHLPGEIELASVHGVSRQTVRTALTRLTQEGLITEGRGRLGRTVRDGIKLRWDLGVFERGPRRDNAATGMDDWAAGVAAQGCTPRQTVNVTIEPAPKEIADSLGIAEGEMAVRRSRVRYVNDRPYQLSTSWFPESISRGTPLMQAGDVAMPGGILKAIGHPQARIRDELYVRMPTPTEKDQLDLPIGTPVAQHVRTGYDAADRPVRVMVTIAPGDRHVLVYELEV
ncbi:GntR family transcriptional regulator [Embleya sp. NPDC059237]|uniref:GntR family transcriptional regulator n=1 Tax=Embleya sp. NPDC059237 TaxID=3346784 RepID=UPI0036C1C287